jgi:hypothetical protein
MSQEISTVISTLAKSPWKKTDPSSFVGSATICGCLVHTAHLNLCFFSSCWNLDNLQFYSFQKLSFLQWQRCRQKGMPFLSNNPFIPHAIGTRYHLFHWLGEPQHKHFRTSDPWLDFRLLKHRWGCELALKFVQGMHEFCCQNSDSYIVFGHQWTYS